MNFERRFLPLAAWMLLGSAAFALPQPKELIAAAQRVEAKGSYSVTMEVHRHLPLTNNLSEEIYFLDARKLGKGKWDLLLRGGRGTNNQRVLSCISPCETAVVKWPGRPAVRLRKGDPRLYLASAMTPSEELRLVANMTSPRLEKTEPLPRENATRYTYKLLGGRDLVTFMSQLWSVGLKENNDILRVQLTLSNKDNLPKRMTILKKIKKNTDPPQKVYEKVWNFKYK